MIHYFVQLKKTEVNRLQKRYLIEIFRILKLPTVSLNLTEFQSLERIVAAHSKTFRSKLKGKLHSL